MSIIGHGLRRSLLGLALLAAPHTAAAQSPSESLPIELVNALFADGGRSTGTLYFVGTVPPGWPAALVPPAPARVVGGMRSRRQLTIAFADSATRQPLATYQRRLREAGWSQPASRALSGFQSGGFQGSDGTFAFWCSDSARVIAMMRPSGGSLDYVRISYELMPRGTCAPALSAEPPIRERNPLFTLLTIPPLYAPTGLHSRGVGTGSGGNSIHTGTRFDSTAMTPSAMLAHYATQLVAAGWRASAPTAEPAFAAQLFEAQDELKRTWRGVLMVTATGVVRDLSLMMARPDDRSGMGSSSSTTRELPPIRSYIPPR